MQSACTANVPGSLLRKVTYDSGLDHVHFHPLAPSAQRNTLAVANLQVDRDRHLMQQVSRDNQALIDLLAVVAQPGRDVHRVAKVGELAFGIAALADDHRTGMQPSAEAWHDGEL